ncbi:unnamed protein product [Prorocentrum cordatum]|uniref:VWFA domain-containing protein n=1 Tax=Prorocentrum cordatum TaxID=2364126 RepID=A0ABN9REM6_9DINO|nr:unnamed protein product [Polarella glacialis]
MAGATWRRVVSAVADVVTDELLEDPCVSLVFVAFSDQAVEVPPPRRAAELRELLLSREYSPQGGTSFKAAFALAQAAVLRELSKHAGQGRPARDVDLAALVFTDGEDTSVKGARGRHGVRLVDQVASRAAARAAGDAFREALRGTGCATHLCVAAFGEDHDPGQCQYLSDRYFYINRGEALADVLAGGLGALLSSAGQCGLRLQLPPGVALEEPIPASLPLDSQGRLDHHVWLRVEADAIDAEERLSVDVDVAGAPVLRGSAAVRQAADVDADSFEGHAFVLDLVALQLRQIARGLCGRRPGACELGKLRERLTEAKGRVQPTRAAAHSARGHLRGRAALRERLAEVDSARERLSYALGQFDEHDVNDSRQIGSVAIDAILRDAGQHVPQGPAAAGLARRAAALAALPAPEALSKHGVEYTTDAGVGGFVLRCSRARQSGRRLVLPARQRAPAPGRRRLCCRGRLLRHDLLRGLPAAVPRREAARQERGDRGRGLHPPGRAALRHGGPLCARQAAPARRPPPAEPRRLLPAGRVGTPAPRPPRPQPGRGPGQDGGPDGGAAAQGARGARRAGLDAQRDAGRVAAGRRGRGRRALPGRAEREGGLRRPLRHGGGRPAGAGVGRGGGRGAGLCGRGGGAAPARGACAARRGRGAAPVPGVGAPGPLRRGLDGLWLDRELPCPDAGELLLSGSGFCPFRAPEELESLEAAWPGRAAPRPAGAAALLSVLSGKRGASDNGPHRASGPRSERSCSHGGVRSGRSAALASCGQPWTR